MSKSGPSFNLYTAEGNEEIPFANEPHRFLISKTSSRVER